MQRAGCSPHAVKNRRAEKVLKTVPFVRIDPSEETDAPLVRFPQSEAPVLTGMITRKPALAQVRRRQVPLKTQPYSPHLLLGIAGADIGLDHLRVV